MTGVGCLEGDLKTFLITHLPHDNDVGRLSEHVPHPFIEGFSVTADFALVDITQLMDMQIFDRVFK